MKACEEAAREEGFGALDLVATLPGEPLYRTFGYEVVERFDISLPDDVKLPVARMHKRLTI
jgi:hypothetical protein